VYLVLTGRRELIPVIPLVYAFCIVLDSVDGEVARYKNLANPVGGKLLDGICHRATEYSLLAAYATAAYVNTGSSLAVAAGLLVLTGDAMNTYVYERRVSALRVQAGYKGHVRFSPDRVYTRGTPFSKLTRKQQYGAVAGLFNYKSVYAVIALSYFPPEVFIGGLAAIGVYKHWKWVSLASRTLRLVRELVPEGVDQTPPQEMTTAPERVAL
jgi:phosphatidylglycerophosphate synthase